MSWTKMFKEEIKGIDSSPGVLRKFGFIFAVIFGIIAGIMFINKISLSWFMIVTGLHFLGFALFAQKFLIIPHKIWMVFALILGNIMSRLILIITFYFAITPLNLLIKVMGKDLLSLRIDKKRESYWEAKERKIFKKDDFEKQY
ncbi:MAG: hypothetical protein GX452_12810 [Ignavibacteriales bacterium]|jgi:hypothetical protein|nr:SxtJ family membrane protein [Ignavibacteriaceae bacterium]NLH62272.1 hypothetical protein [Ignavibacteriales bacterium]HOJ16959.1 SxtJ family membrane protein [Ignavibacteriaceae bacterium]HPO56698.1 SxtJ family membrane protein [Ignavibacteriaceae bacterium]